MGAEPLRSQVEAWPWPDALDALVAASAYHTLILENERVRVVRTRIPSGHAVPVHTHRWPCVLLVLDWSDIVRRDHLGQVTLDTRMLPEVPKLNTPTYQDALPPHSVENVGGGELNTLQVEIKALS